MARADLLVSLVKAGTTGNQALFRKTVEAIVAEERNKRHNTLAEQLVAQLSATPAHEPTRLSAPLERSGLYRQRIPRRRLDHLVLPEMVLETCRELVEEQQRRQLLQSHGLEPRHKILLVGPPGNGKTSLAEALASEMMVDLLVVRYDALIGSFLGETAARLSKLFEDVRSRQCVLFLIEFDTVAKERGDENETGEVKRIVSSLLLEIDDLPPHVVTVMATNHSELLDRAVWRRFEAVLELPPPPPSLMKEWLSRFEEETGFGLGVTHDTVQKKLGPLSFAELEEFALDVYRRVVLEGPDAKPKAITLRKLMTWTARRKVVEAARALAGGVRES